MTQPENGQSIWNIMNPGESDPPRPAEPGLAPQYSHASGVKDITAALRGGTSVPEDTAAVDGQNENLLAAATAPAEELAGVSESVREKVRIETRVHTNLARQALGITAARSANLVAHATAEPDAMNTLEQGLRGARQSIGRLEHALSGSPMAVSLAGEQGAAALTAFGDNYSPCHNAIHAHRADLVTGAGSMHQGLDDAASSTEAAQESLLVLGNQQPPETPDAAYVAMRGQHYAAATAVLRAEASEVDRVLTALKAGSDLSELLTEKQAAALMQDLLAAVHDYGGSPAQAAQLDGLLGQTKQWLDRISAETDGLRQTKRTLATVASGVHHAVERLREHSPVLASAKE